LPDTLPLPIQLSWLIPLYGFSGMLLSLPWAAGWIKRNGPRPAAYLNLLVTLLAVLHGSLVLGSVLALGPQHLDIAWFSAADLDLRIGFDLSLTNLAALELVTGLSLVGQVFALGYLDKEWSLARFYGPGGLLRGGHGRGGAEQQPVHELFPAGDAHALHLPAGGLLVRPAPGGDRRPRCLPHQAGGGCAAADGGGDPVAWAGSLEFNDLYAWSANGNPAGPGATLLGLALIAGPMGKCAQFPMHLWLDEAMEGPNPASILRNSVVVTCGAVVLLKVMPLLLISPVAIDVLLAVGTISAVGGALVAISQVDLKRACSYSTTSYLGLVFIAIALQQPFIALLLLFSHALAKAVLFMSVGSVIATTNCQDLTELGGLGSRMPATTTGFLVGAAGLTGLLPLGCFWSFGLMVEGLGSRAPFFAAVVLLTNGLTALNLTRVYRQVFLGAPHPKTRPPRR
jgi:NAD(P)H-quinone oxidoreductase subunit 5